MPHRAMLRVLRLSRPGAAAFQAPAAGPATGFLEQPRRWSRVGRRPISLPPTVSLTMEPMKVAPPQKWPRTVPLHKVDKDPPSLAVAKGELGELSMVVPAGLTLRFEGEGTAFVDCEKEKAKAVWPTMRSLVENMVIGVSQVR